MSRRVPTEDEIARIDRIAEAIQGITIYDAASLCASVLSAQICEVCERLDLDKKESLRALGNLLQNLCAEAYKSEQAANEKSATKVADSILDGLGVKVRLH